MSDEALAVWISAATHKGYARRSNEDTILADSWVGYGESASHSFEWVVDGRGLLLAVADGLGGHRAGEVASRFVVEQLLWRSEPSSWGKEESLADLLSGIDADLRDQALGAPSLQGMGSTLAAAYVAMNGLTIANVGDSRAYIFDHQDGLRQVSLDHVPPSANYDGPPKNARRTTHAITQAFGGSALRARALRPHILRLPLTEREFSLLLCSDGLSDLVDDSGLSNALASGRMGAHGFVRQALEAGGIDNVSVIVAHFGRSGMSAIKAGGF